MPCVTPAGVGQGLAGMEEEIKEVKPTMRTPMGRFDVIIAPRKWRLGVDCGRRAWQSCYKTEKFVGGQRETVI